MSNKVKKIMKGTPLHLAKSGELKGFIYLMINLPFLCNYRCQKCFNLKDDNFHFQGRPISINKIFSLIEEAKNLGGKVVVMAGEGEPGLNKNVKKIVKKINSAGLLSIVYTNGTTLTKAMANFYAAHNTTLVVSLDSLSAELYLKLTGNTDKNVFQKVLKNIKRTRKIYGQLIERKNGYQIVRLAINATVSNLNKDEIKKIKSFCGQDIYFICNPLAKLGNATNNWDKLMKGNNDSIVINKIIKQMSETTGPLTLGSNGLCGYSINGIAVSPSGNYMTCAYTSLTDGLLGTVFNKSLAESYKYKNKQEINFYKTYGRCPCLVRSPKFNDYLKTLKTHKH